MTIDDLNGIDRRGFTAALGDVFEHSSWVAERAWEARPFASLEALHAALVGVVRRALPEEQLALLRAHPDLAGRAARSGAMSGSSVVEQASTGLDRLTSEEYDCFTRLNTAYRERFGFPFIIAVRRHTKASILAAFRSRLGRKLEDEMDAALTQVCDIARLRLETLLTAK